jgi:hypothetical protein
MTLPEVWTFNDESWLSVAVAPNSVYVSFSCNVILVSPFITKLGAVKSLTWIILVEVATLPYSSVAVYVMV